MQFELDDIAEESLQETPWTFDFRGLEGSYRFEIFTALKIYKLMFPPGKFIYGNFAGILNTNDEFIIELEDGAVLTWMRKILNDLEITEPSNESNKNL